MKTLPQVLGAAAMVAALSAPADTTINAADRHAWGANIGWLNARGDVINGAMIGQQYCTGYVWSANAGWICLGNGPANGWQYSNASAADWGVNHDGAGRLFGSAYGANVGWINFEQEQGRPRIDLATGILDGFAYGANIGWIGLSNAQAFVRTDALGSGPDTDGDGIPDDWELRETGGLALLSGGGHDADGDGATDVQEAAADTRPLDPNSHLGLLELARDADTNLLSWTIVPTRFYRIEWTANLADPDSWTDSGFGLMPPDPDKRMTRSLFDPGKFQRFYRVKAVAPLSQ